QHLPGLLAQRLLQRGVEQVAGDLVVLLDVLGGHRRGALGEVAVLVPGLDLLRDRLGPAVGDQERADRLGQILDLAGEEPAHTNRVEPENGAVDLAFDGSVLARFELHGWLCGRLCGWVWVVVKERRASENEPRTGRPARGSC